MQLSSESFKDGAVIPGEFAFCVPAREGHVALSTNLNPQLAWAGAPAGTQSFALICHDPDVPSRGDDVNQPGRTIPADLPRVEFVHWLMADIPAECGEFDEGACCDGITPRGKRNPPGSPGSEGG